MSDKPLPVALLEMISGGWTAGAIAVAARLGIADQLAAGPRSVTDLASATKSHAPTLSRLMRYLASIGVFTEQEDGRYAITPLGGMIRKDAPGSMRDAAIFFASHHAQRPWEQAEYSLRTGKASFDHMYGTNPWEWYATHPDDAAEFNACMTALSGTLHKAAVETYDFTGIRSIMDVGGGHGRLLAQILAKEPSMRGILFDQPHVVNGAAPVFAEYGVQDRARAVGGSFFESLPTGADAHIMAHIIHDWDDEHAHKILEKCRAAIDRGPDGRGGRLLIVDAVIAGRNEPDFGKLLDLEMLLVPGGKERTADEFAKLMAGAGWKLTRVIPTPAGKSIIEGVPA